MTQRPAVIKHKGPFFVYMVRCSRGTLYTGYTNDLDNRLKLHNSGRGAKYLRGRAPVRLVYLKKYRIYQSALAAEREIKKLTRPQKEQLIMGTHRS
ncbi:MAG: GIY-YIG nuclease family protein [Candidatus Omnitrophica bacterium]|nr:GIY-YIG nuclease family protein [Candidatus Omnitrophota bacterium]